MAGNEDTTQHPEGSPEEGAVQGSYEDREAQPAEDSASAVAVAGDGSGEREQDEFSLSEEFGSLVHDDLASAEIREALPFSADLMDLLIRLIQRSGVEIRRFLDLGCGDAVMSAAVLKHYPAAGGVLLDTDEPSLERAWGRLGASADKLAFVAQDVSEPDWAEAVRTIAPFDLVISGYVINQQRDEHKLDVYTDIFDLLGPGGLFLNLDYVSTSAPFARLVFDDLYLDSLMRLRSAQGREAGREAAEQAYRDWPDRPMLNPSQTDLQCEWLREIGFVGVDCFFRAIGVALIGGVKPKKPAAPAS